MMKIIGMKDLVLLQLGIDSLKNLTLKPELVFEINLSNMSSRKLRCKYPESIILIYGFAINEFENDNDESKHD